MVDTQGSQGRQRLCSSGLIFSWCFWFSFFFFFFFRIWDVSVLGGKYVDSASKSCATAISDVQIPNCGTLLWSSGNVFFAYFLLSLGHKQKHSRRRGGGVWFWRGSCRFISHVAIQPTAYSESARFLSVGQLWWLIHLAANCPVHSEKCRLDFITARCKGEYCIWRRFCIGISSCIWTLVNIWEKKQNIRKMYFVFLWWWWYENVFVGSSI